MLPVLTQMPRTHDVRMRVVNTDDFQVELSYQIDPTDWNSPIKWGFTTAWVDQLYRESGAEYVELVNSVIDQGKDSVHVTESWRVVLPETERLTLTKWINASLPEPKPKLKSRRFGLFGKRPQRLVGIMR